MLEPTVIINIIFGILLTIKFMLEQRRGFVVRRIKSIVSHEIDTVPHLKDVKSNSFGFEDLF